MRNMVLLFSLFLCGACSDSETENNQNNTPKSKVKDEPEKKILSSDEAEKKITINSSAKDDAAAICACLEGAIAKSTKEESEKAVNACMETQKSEGMTKKLMENKSYSIKEFTKEFNKCVEPLKRQAAEKFQSK